MGQHLRSDGTVDTSSFKIVYVAPMKALVAEMVGNFSQRLKKFGMQVDHLFWSELRTGWLPCNLGKLAESFCPQACSCYGMPCRAAMLSSSA